MQTIVHLHQCRAWVGLRKQQRQGVLVKPVDGLVHFYHMLAIQFELHLYVDFLATSQLQIGYAFVAKGDIKVVISLLLIGDLLSVEYLGLVYRFRLYIKLQVHELDICGDDLTGVRVIQEFLLQFERSKFLTVSRIIVYRSVCIEGNPTHDLHLTFHFIAKKKGGK